MKNLSHQKGAALVASVLLLLLLGLFLNVGVAVTRTDKAGSVQDNKSAEALAIATAGANWYLNQLLSDSDWSNNSTEALPGQGASITRNFAGGTFTITVNSAAASSLDFTSTASVAATTSNYAMIRMVRLTATKT